MILKTNFMKKNKPHVAICINPKLIKLLENGNYNVSKLIDKLLTKYFKEKSSLKN